MPPATSSTAGAPGRGAVVVIHGPNLDLLGVREPEVYGTTTLAQLDDRITALADALGVDVEVHQTNGEGAFIELLHDARTRAGLLGVIVNPGGYTHTSVAITDALAAVDAPVVEVHLTNLYAREEFRHTSRTAAACRGGIMGLGPDSYLLALRHLVAIHADSSRATTMERT